MAKQQSSKTAEVKPPVKKEDLKGLKKLLDLTQEEKISYSIVLFLVFLVVAIRSNFFEISFERDEGAYSYYGKLLLEGKVPYKDFYEQKFPGMFYFFAMIVGIFGDTVKGMHMGFMWVNIISMLFLFAASRRLFSPLAGVVTATTFAIVSMCPNLSGYTVQGEHAVAFFVSIGLYLYTYTVTNGHWKYYLFTGLAFGCAFMTKTSGLFLAFWGGVITISDFFFTRQNRPLKELIIKGLIYTGGIVSIVLLMFTLIYLKGSFSEMIFWTYEIPKNYVNKIPWEQGKTYLEFTYKAVTAEYKFFWMHALAALAVFLLKNINWRLKFFALTLIFLSGMTVVPGYYFYGHYWIQIIPGLSMLAGLTFFAFTDSLKNRFNIRSPKVGYAYVVVFLIITFTHLSRLKDYYFNPNYDRILRTVYGNNPFPEARGISNWINANTKPEDGLVVMGSEPQMYFYTKKKCPSRHAYFAAIVDNVPEHKQWQREFVSDVEKAKPKYFVFFNHQISLFVQPNTDRYVFDWYNKYVQENYNLIGCVDMVDGYASTYAWREQLANFRPQSQSVVYIYERKS